MLKITYSSIDAAYIQFSEGPAVDSIEVSDGIIFDLNTEDEVIGIEILDLNSKTADEIKDIYKYTEYSLKPEDALALKTFFTSAIPCLA